MIKGPRAFVRALGIALILLGILALVGQFLQLNIGAFVWPFFVIVPGVLIFLFAVAADVPLSEPFAMVSGMVTMVGLVLLYQSVTGHWTSWAYVWALITPTGIGLAEMLYGWSKGRESAVRTGSTLVNIGLIMFLVGLVFFELILNISGLGLDFVGWPILFIGLGLLALIRGLLVARRP